MATTLGRTILKRGTDSLVTLSDMSPLNQRVQEDEIRREMRLYEAQCGEDGIDQFLIRVSASVAFTPIQRAFARDEFERRHAN